MRGEVSVTDIDLMNEYARTFRSLHHAANHASISEERMQALLDGKAVPSDSVRLTARFHLESYRKGESGAVGIVRHRKTVRPRTKTAVCRDVERVVDVWRHEFNHEWVRVKDIATFAPILRDLLLTELGLLDWNPKQIGWWLKNSRRFESYADHGCQRWRLLS